MSTSTIATATRSETSRRAALLTSAAAGALLVAGLAIAAPAMAQDAAGNQGAEESQQSESLLALEEIVVTGRFRGDALRKLDASYAITSVSDFEIEKFSPKSTADLFKMVPGVWVESSGGEAGANIFVRGFPGSGDADFVTVQVDGLPIFPPPTLSFLENSSLFRIDETVERLEALRGGPNPVVSNGQPGVTFNFIQKEGGPDPEGLIRLTGSDFGEKRLDAQFSGPLGDDLYYSIGGFFRSSDGIRSAQFNSERGGQISAKLTKELERGKISLYARYLDDRNAWLLPIPVVSDANGRISQFGNFDLGTGNLIGNDTRLAVLEVGRNGETVKADLADGRGAELFLIGGSASFDFGDGWSLSEKFNFMSGDANTRGLVPATTPRSLGDFLGEVAPAGVGGSFSFASTGEAITDLSMPVMTAGWWFVNKDLQSFTNDVSLSKELFTANTFTLGVFFSDYSSNDLWYLGNNQLLTAEPNARRVDLALDDGTQVTRGGFVGAPFFDVNAAYNGRNIAAYFADEWDITDRLRVDAGIRIENQKVDATLENVDFGVDLDNDPTTLFNNGAAVLNGTFRTIDFDETETAWTVGANYFLTDEMAVFARINNGQKFPQFDNLRDGADQIQSIDQYEIGFKASTAYYGVFATLFYNDFTGLPIQRFVNGQNVIQLSGSSAVGVEAEVVTQPVEGLRLSLTGTWQDADFDKDGNFPGKRVQRQPRLQLRFSPSYEVPLSFGILHLYGTLTHVGSRFSDPENLQPLGSYQKLDAGIILDVADQVTLQVVADNLTDSHALTEGNPRIIGAQTGVIFARPILGRSFRFSASYHF